MFVLGVVEEVKKMFGDGENVEEVKVWEDVNVEIGLYNIWISVEDLYEILGVEDSKVFKQEITGIMFVSFSDEGLEYVINEYFIMGAKEIFVVLNGMIAKKKFEDDMDEIMKDWEG